MFKFVGGLPASQEGFDDCPGTVGVGESTRGANVDRLSWKIRAIVAQEEREKVSRRVRDNLRYLRRNGKLLGTIPQGYRRVDGQIVEDPAAAPAIKEIFNLYASGRFSL